MCQISEAFEQRCQTRRADVRGQCDEAASGLLPTLLERTGIAVRCAPSADETRSAPAYRQVATGITYSVRANAIKGVVRS